MLKGIRIQKSLATSMSVQTKMLEFADRHKRKPAIEIFTFE
jgi:D-arabinose 1-dehydrogenase-like Zn-dependent alcohol dehydrogenase